MQKRLGKQTYRMKPKPTTKQKMGRKRNSCGCKQSKGTAMVWMTRRTFEKDKASMSSNTKKRKLLLWRKYCDIISVYELIILRRLTCALFSLSVNYVGRENKPALYITIMPVWIFSVFCCHFEPMIVYNTIILT